MRRGIPQLGRAAHAQLWRAALQVGVHQDARHPREAARQAREPAVRSRREDRDARAHSARDRVLQLTAPRLLGGAEAQVDELGLEVEGALERLDDDLEGTDRLISEDLDGVELRPGRVVEDGVIYSQPISEGGNNWTSKPIQTHCRKVEGGYVINGMKKWITFGCWMTLCSATM